MREEYILDSDDNAYYNILLQFEYEDQMYNIRDVYNDIICKYIQLAYDERDSKQVNTDYEKEVEELVKYINSKLEEISKLGVDVSDSIILPSSVIKKIDIN